MATIRTAIELEDNFSGILNNIINSVNLTISAMDDMRQSMNSEVDASSLEGARDQINQATIATRQLSEALDNVNAKESSAPVTMPVEPVIPDPIVEQPPPVQVPVEWQTDNLEVFTGTGFERFNQEMQSANQMLDQLSSTQNTIAKQAYNTNFFPPEMFRDLNSMAVRIDMIRGRIQQLESNQLNVGTEAANAELEHLRGQLNQALQSQESLNQAMQNMDISGANEAYNQLSSNIGNTERYIRDNIDEQGRFNRTIEQGKDNASNLMQMIKGAAAAYVSVRSLGSAVKLSDSIASSTAKLNIMNDGLQSTEQLQKMIFNSAERARGSYTDTMNTVAKLGNLAGDAFGSSEEVIGFAEQLQKQFVIAGAGTSEIQNATLQLTQALSSGVLRGDELNSIFEQAPTIIQSIANYLDVPMGQIRDMASEGELTADIVKNAMFAAADETNAKFESMPKTFEQIGQSIQNNAIMAFQPILQRINEIANSEDFQNFVNGIINAIAFLAGVVTNVFELIVRIGKIISENWSQIAPIIFGIAVALAVYYGWQMLCAAASKIVALAAHPILLAIIYLIFIIFKACNAIAKFTGAAESGFGIICGSVNVAIQFIKNFGLSVANIALGIYETIKALCHNIKTAFHNAICNVQAWWYDLLSTAFTVVEGICRALNKLPFVDFDYSVISSAADDYAAKAAAATGRKEQYESIGAAFDKGMNKFDTFQDGWASKAFKSGAAWGDGITKKIANFDIGDIFGSNIPSKDKYGEYNYGNVPGASDFGVGDIGNDVNSIANDTDDIKDVVTMSEDMVELLRKIAEREVINKFTTAEVKLEMNNNNQISSDMDIDGLGNSLIEMLEEGLKIAAEGVHA